MHEYACVTCGNPTVWGWKVVHFDPRYDVETERVYCQPECVRLAMVKHLEDEAKRARENVHRDRKAAKEKLDLVLTYVPKKRLQEVRDRLYREHLTWG